MQLEAFQEWALLQSSWPYIIKGLLKEPSGKSHDFDPHRWMLGFQCGFHTSEQGICFEISRRAETRLRVD